MDAIRQFAGPAPDVAVVPPEVRTMMVEYEATAAHYDVAGTFHVGERRRQNRGTQEPGNR